MTSTSASTGWPEVTAILPPKRRPNFAPRPASKQRRTAIGIPDRADAGVLDLALDQVPQDLGVVRRRAAAGIVGRIGDHDRQVVEGHALADAGLTSKYGGWVLPRNDTSSSPSAVASASAFFLSPSAITSTRVPISATSP